MEYTFKHALTHEVAYGGILRERRRVLHGRLVDALLHQAGERLEEQVERLAHHAFWGERWEAAITHGRRAAAKAMSHSAAREALGYLEGPWRRSGTFRRAGRLRSRRSICGSSFGRRSSRCRIRDRRRTCSRLRGSPKDWAMGDDWAE